MWIENDALSLGASTDEALRDLTYKVSRAAVKIVRTVHARTAA